MVAADNLPSVTAPYVEPSWNLPDVFVGLSESGTAPPAPLALRQSADGAFTVTSRFLKGGGAVLIRIDPGTTGAIQLLDLRASLSTPQAAGSPIGLAAVRIE